MAANPAPMSARELHRPRRVLIAGGGTAGWITAFLLRSTAPPDVTITVVDSAADASALGAGESTLPGFRNLLRSAGIDEGEFFAETDATFRLGVRFRQWNPARDFWHPFGAVLGPSVLVTDWLRTAARDGGAAIDDVLDQGTGKVAAARLAPQSAGCPPYTGELRAFGYHADTARLADLVRDRAIAAGVRRVADDVTDAEVGPGGWIRQVRTAAHGPLEADLFFDCTGFRGQLIRQALGEPFDPFSRHLWCDKAVTIDVPAGPAASARPAALHRVHGAQRRVDLGDPALQPLLHRLRLFVGIPVPAGSGNRTARPSRGARRHSRAAHHHAGGEVPADLGRELHRGRPGRRVHRAA